MTKIMQNFHEVDWGLLKYSLEGTCEFHPSLLHHLLKSKNNVATLVVYTRKQCDILVHYCLYMQY